MYQSDGKRRRQALVYFGKPEDSSANVAGGAFRGARGTFIDRNCETLGLGEL